MIVFLDSLYENFLADVENQLAGKLDILTFISKNIILKLASKKLTYHTKETSTYYVNRNEYKFCYCN